jgi:hypothetical protein
LQSIRIFKLYRAQDWDIFVPPFDDENFAKINIALQDDLDCELEKLDIATGDGFVQTFQTAEGIIQFHLSPPGLQAFDKVEARASVYDYKGIPVKYLCLDDLLDSKLAVARNKDSDDILFLQTKKNHLNCNK